MKHVLQHLLLTCSALALMAVQAAACECTERRTVEQEFAASEHVVVLILDSVENEKATLSVAMRYQGDLKIKERLVFKQSAGKDCKWRFDEQDIHKLFLFYLDERPENGVWQASTCSRSAPVGEVGEDIRYLLGRPTKPRLLIPLRDYIKPTISPRVAQEFERSRENQTCPSSLLFSSFRFYDKI